MTASFTKTELAKRHLFLKYMYQAKTLEVVYLCVKAIDFYIWNFSDNVFYSTYCVVFFFVMMPVYLDCPFVIVSQ